MPCNLYLIHITSATKNEHLFGGITCSNRSRPELGKGVRNQPLCLPPGRKCAGSAPGRNYKPKKVNVGFEYPKVNSGQQKGCNNRCDMPKLQKHGSTDGLAACLIDPNASFQYQVKYLVYTRSGLSNLQTMTTSGAPKQQQCT